MNPKEDGVSHINIYSQGKTELGRMLSNFYTHPIQTIDGNFLSVEGYWYWLSIEDCEDKEILRNTYGFNSKKIGKELLVKYNKRFDCDFENKILKSIWYKVRRNANLFLPEYKDLPFEHYYNYNNKIIDVKKRYLWMIQGIDKMRNYIYKEENNCLK